MSDLIKREDVIAVIKRCKDRLQGKGLTCEIMLDMVERIPSADRPQGKWINHFDDLFPEDSTIECSVCHEHQPMGIDENYCPNCGARMFAKDTNVPNKKGADDE